MSGSLAEAVIGAQEACKIYTNSSGNPASITIHAQALDTDKNSCLSIKYSSTDACIQSSSTVSTLDMPIPKTSYISEVSNSLCGFSYTESTECKCNTCPTHACFRDRHFNWCDVTDNVAYTQTLCCIRTQVWCGITNFGDLFGSLQPASDSHFGAGIQCCLRHGFRRDNLIFQKQKNYPSFVTGAGEAWERQTKSKYYVPSSNKNASAGDGECVMGIRFGQEDLCCCIAFCGSRECKRRFFYCGHQCFTSCFYDYACFCNFPWYSQDIWADHTPVFFWGDEACPVKPGGSCQNFHAHYVNNLNTGQSCTVGGVYCRSHYLSQDCDRNHWRECCTCYGCCCCDTWQKGTHISNKYVMAGCDVAFFVGMHPSFVTEIVTYSKSFDCGNNLAQSCRMWGMFRFCQGSNNADYCCIFYPSVVGMGSPMVKWLWYNPYTDCNYFEILGRSASGSSLSPENGIYSIDPSYTPGGATCIIGSTYSTCCYQCKTMADWIAAGFIKCVSGTPSAWSTKVSAYESVTQPQLVAECCFAIWWQCHDWNTIPSEGGWNGCMIQYRSPDLINWEKVETQTIEKTSSGSGDNECIVLLTNTGSDLLKKTNHYFNSNNCVSNSGTLEYKASANRLERTGVVLSNSDKVYVTNTSSTPVAVQIWGYDD